MRPIFKRFTKYFVVDVPCIGYVGIDPVGAHLDIGALTYGKETNFGFSNQQRRLGRIQDKYICKIGIDGIWNLRKNTFLHIVAY